VQCAEDEGDQITWGLVVPAVEIAEGFEHRESADKGRGLFATRMFAGGDVVLTNRPLAITEDEKAQLFDLSNNVITNSSQVLHCMQTSTIGSIAHFLAAVAQPHWCKLQLGHSSDLSKCCGSKTSPGVLMLRAGYFS
jgi:hypothetical protein